MVAISGQNRNIVPLGEKLQVKNTTKSRKQDKITIGSGKYHNTKLKT
jgi:hypothetical protein